jgi:hypothetical protein
MKAPALMILRSLLIGIAATAALTAAASLSFDIGADVAAQILAWPNTLLQSLVTPLEIGTEERPFHEGTPLNVLAYLASFPLSLVVYSVLAYIFLRMRQSKTKESSCVAAKDAGT